MSNLFDLSGKTALITGASRGIGAAVAKAYAKAGAHVVLMARTVGGLEEVDDAIRAAGGTATLISQDLMELDKIDILGPALADRFGGLDIFVGNAGLLGPLTPLSHISAKEWDKVMTLNMTANFRLIRTLDPLLRASQAGRVIVVSTGAHVIRGEKAYWGAYAASKAGLEALARTYAAETQKTNMRVNIINPGAVRTAMRASAVPGEDSEQLPAPDDITGTFLELASESCQKHGETISIDNSNI